METGASFRSHRGIYSTGHIVSNAAIAAQQRDADSAPEAESVAPAAPSKLTSYYERLRHALNAALCATYAESKRQLRGESYAAESRAEQRSEAPAGSAGAVRARQSRDARAVSHTDSQQQSDSSSSDAELGELTYATRY